MPHKYWQKLDDLGSDHYGIMFTVESNFYRVQYPMEKSSFNTKHADWEKFASTIIALRNCQKLLDADPFRILSSSTEAQFPSQATRVINALDSAAYQLMDIIEEAAYASIILHKF